MGQEGREAHEAAKKTAHVSRRTEASLTGMLLIIQSASKLHELTQQTPKLDHMVFWGVPVHAQERCTQVSLSFLTVKSSNDQITGRSCATPQKSSSIRHVPRCAGICTGWWFLSASGTVGQNSAHACFHHLLTSRPRLECTAAVPPSPVEPVSVWLFVKLAPRVSMFLSLVLFSCPSWMRSLTTDSGQKTTALWDICVCI